MGHRLKFFLEFLKRPMVVGSAFPSSYFACRAKLSPIDFKNKIVMLELGPGTGCMTKEILRRMTGDSRLIVFEVVKNFVEILNNEMKDKRLIIIEDDAQKLDDYLKNLKINQVDYILSGIPDAFFPKETRNKLVLTAFKSLKPGGEFIQSHYCYSHKAFEMYNLYKKIFKSIKIRFVLFSIPPILVYVCKK